MELNRESNTRDDAGELAADEPRLPTGRPGLVTGPVQGHVFAHAGVHLAEAMGTHGPDPTKEDATMFAPRIAKPQTKTAGDSTSSLVHPRSTLTAQRHGPVGQALLLQGMGHNQELLVSLTENEFSGDHKQELAPENATAHEVPRGISWDFSKVSLFPA